MNSRRRNIVERRPVYVGCEGESEQAYMALVNEFLREHSIPIALNIEVLGPGAGDPLSRIELAVRRLKRERQTRAISATKFVLLDYDQYEMDPVRGEAALRLAQKQGISVVWQRPCFEAVLLRHLPGQASRQPMDTGGAESALRREWPGYEKPMTMRELRHRIDLDAIERAASVEPDLRGLMECLGLINLRRS